MTGRATERLTEGEQGKADRLLAETRSKEDHVTRFIAAYRHYCWPVASLADLKLAPFHLLASEGRVHADQPHHRQPLDSNGTARRVLTHDSVEQPTAPDESSGAVGVCPGVAAGWFLARMSTLKTLRDLRTSVASVCWFCFCIRRFNTEVPEGRRARRNFPLVRAC